MKGARASAMLLVMVLLSITLSSAFAARSLAETLATSSLTPLPVLDVNGKVVRSGANYYVLPALTFGPVNTKSGYTVRTFTDLNIRFVVDTPCEEGTVWKVDDYDDDVQQWFVATGGVEGNPGPRTVKNWFKIWKYGSNYKLTYCPAVCKSCKVDCKDVGIYVDENGGRRLALVDKDGDPFVIKFVKAD
ncbi:unnamed protein product [Linum tenue]|uniref:Uncharacterized protein n=1 Tax=Linum tenue TaxID=586396 RepID=A0AAV0QH95_9ROSI|nr:unnamed protein product [Linum tenue]